MNVPSNKVQIVSPIVHNNAAVMKASSKPAFLTTRNLVQSRAHTATAAMAAKVMVTPDIASGDAYPDPVIVPDPVGVGLRWQVAEVLKSSL